MAIRFYNQDVSSGLKGKRKLAEFLQALIKKQRPEVKEIALTYIFCNDDYLLEMNKEFLEHDTFTDILTFDMSEDAETLIGEVYISIERVKENAHNFKVDYRQELHRVIFHGALHLCGFKDKTETEKNMMRIQEDRYLKQYFEE